MRVLLDTNVLIHREASTAVRSDIGQLFRWLDRLGHQKCVHPLSRGEIERHRDAKVRRTFRTKLDSYHELKTVAPLAPLVEATVGSNDRTENDRIDTRLVNELHAGRVDILITEDKGIRRKAEALEIADRVYTIDAYLEKVTSENPELADYQVLAVRKVLIGELSVQQPFFDSFRADYGGPEFDRWFASKSDDEAYVCTEADRLVAFLYLKTETPAENYSNIVRTPLGK